MDLAVEGIEDCLSGEVQRPHVDGDVLRTLRDGVTGRVTERGGEVSAVDDERVAGAQDLLGHLVDRGRERVLQHLECDRIEPVAGLTHFAFTAFSLMFSHSSTDASTSGGTTVVESTWSTTAGPWNRCPASSSSRR